MTIGFFAKRPYLGGVNDPLDRFQAHSFSLVLPRRLHERLRSSDRRSTPSTGPFLPSPLFFSGLTETSQWTLLVIGGVNDPLGFLQIKGLDFVLSRAFLYGFIS